MGASNGLAHWMAAVRQGYLAARTSLGNRSPSPPRIGLALGGGFARGIAHAGVLRALERNSIPIHCIAGVSSGSIIAAAYASGATPDAIGRTGCSMRFADVARWSIGRMGFAASERMVRFLAGLLRCSRFEEMQIRLGVVATDLYSGSPVSFHGSGDVVLPIRASCAYPGLFQPVSCGGSLLVDGAISMEVPAYLCRQLGATHVVSVHLPARPEAPPANMFQVVNRSFQILQARTEQSWRAHSDLVISPDVHEIDWDAFASGPKMIDAGEAAALAALPRIRHWLGRTPGAFPAVMPGSIPA